jgi:hypothetical protein
MLKDCTMKRHNTKPDECGALDPVSDPVYNMKEIIKQSLLLEDHLVERKKRCRDCICKHFLTIIALQEESLSLAGSRNYPMMRENAIFYEALYNMWLEKKDEGEDIYLWLSNKLRKRRKELVSVYVFGNFGKFGKRPIGR